MANYSIREDLIDGKKGEDIVLQYILYNNKNIELLTKRITKASDLILYNKDTNTNIQVEVKTDYYCRPNKDTYNIFIEYECRGNPSGILTTQSDVYIYYYVHYNKAYSILTKDLKEFIYKALKVNDIKGIRVVDGAGDEGSNTKGILINRIVYEDIFNVVDIHPDRIGY
jgi:hypothetical protein